MDIIIREDRRKEEKKSKPTFSKLTDKDPVPLRVVKVALNDDDEDALLKVILMM